MEAGFVKGASDNLPRVDMDMMNDFYMNNMQYLSAEVQNVKTKRAARENYENKAVSHVQVKHEAGTCTVKGKITPEHRIRSRDYNVCAVIDEKEDKIVSCACLDCAAAAGGCKHGVAFLYWLHRRSEEPAVTSVESYWRKSALSKVAQSGSFTNIEVLSGTQKPQLQPKDPTIATEFVSRCGPLNGGMFDFFNDPPFKNTAVYQLALSYKKEPAMHTPEGFISFMAHAMTVDSCRAAEEASREQADCTAWFELRFARITASLVYEASNCKTTEGALMERIMGAAQPLSTDAVSRGKQLETLVLREVAKQKNLTVEKAGLFLDPQYPIYGASPDGITADYCIEIKCPSKETSVVRYLRGNTIEKKFWYQLQLQMLFAKRQKGLFVVASPDFETTQKITYIEVELDKDECIKIMDKATAFWKNAIYPKLLN